MHSLSLGTGGARGAVDALLRNSSHRREEGKCASRPVGTSREARWPTAAVVRPVPDGAGSPRCNRAAPPWSAQRLTTNALPSFASAEQEFFSAVVILRVLTVTALLCPSVPLGAGPVTVSGTNQK